MHVLIFEMDHFEVAYPLIRMSLDARYKVTALVYPFCVAPLHYMLGKDAASVNWVIKKDSTSKRDFINKIIFYANQIKPDRIFINTVADNHIFFARALKKLRLFNPVVTLHNVKSFFEYKYRPNFRRIVRIIGKKQLLFHAQQIAVISCCMLPYLENHLSDKKKIYVIPGGLFERVEKNIPPISFKCRIVVPGSLDTRRRNYEEVFNLAAILELQQVPSEIRLLGTPQGRGGYDIISKASQWKGQYCTFLLHHSEQVSQQDYDQSIRESHFLLAAQHTHLIVDDEIVEEYGKTITSGNIFDAIRNVTPMLHSSKISLDKRVASMTLLYADTQELSEIIREYQQREKKYEALMQSTFNCVQAFTSAAQLVYLSDLFPIEK